MSYNQFHVMAEFKLSSDVTQFKGEYLVYAKIDFLITSLAHQLPC